MMKIAAMILLGALLSFLGGAPDSARGAHTGITIEARKSVIVVETAPLGTTVTAIAVKLSRVERFGNGSAATAAFQLLEEGKPRSIADGYTNSTASRSSTPRRGDWLILTVHQHPVYPGTTAISRTYALKQKSDLVFSDAILRASRQTFGLVNTVDPDVDRYTAAQFSNLVSSPSTIGCSNRQRHKRRVGRLYCIRSF